MTGVGQRAMRVLLVGAGEQGWESRGPSIRALAPAAELAGVADPDARQLRWTAERLGVSATWPSMAEALAAEPVDAVILAVPNALHEPLTVEALEAGCHVLCEKPMALDAAGGERMIAAAQRAERVLTVGYPYPFMHPVLAELDLGATTRVEARWTRRDGIPSQPAFWDPGVGADLLGHLLSVVRVGIKHPPRWVSAFGWRERGRALHGLDFRGYDTVEALVAFDGDVTAHLLVAWAANQAEDERIGVTFETPECSVEVPLIGRELDVERFRPLVRENDGVSRVLDRVPVQTEECFVDQARNWLAAARGEEELLFGPHDALAIQRVLDAAAASVQRRGEPVAV